MTKVFLYSGLEHVKMHQNVAFPAKKIILGVFHPLTRLAF